MVLQETRGIVYEDDPSPAYAVLPLLKDSSFLALDLEWTASAKKDTMIWPWSNLGQVYSMSLTGRVNGSLVSCAIAWPPHPTVERAVRKLLETRPVVMHNAMADGLWLRSLGISYTLKADTMLLSHLIDESQRASLELVATRYSEEVKPGWKGVLCYTRPESKVEWERVLSYNAEDTRATLLAFEGEAAAIQQLPPERRDAVLNLHKHLLLPAVPVLLLAAYAGVPVDKDYLLKLLQESRARQDRSIEDLAEAASITPMQARKLAGSSDKTISFLAGYGITIDDAQKDTLADLSKYPAVEAILRFKKEMKLLSTYLEPWLNMINRQRDGRLHTVYRLTGTRTGRMSAESEEGGSLQVAPRDTADVQFRQMVAAPPGRLIIAGDFATIEMRFAALYAGEDTMLEEFERGGGDIHRQTAAFLLAQRTGVVSLKEFLANKEHYEKQVTKELRQVAKGSNFGLTYGQGVQGFQDYAKTHYGIVLTLEEAAAIRNAFFELYPRLLPWHARSRNDAVNKGYTETPFGRRRSFDASDANAAINTPVQAMASDYTLLAMIQIYKRFQQERIKGVVIGYVHDSIIAEVVEADADRALEVFKYEMTHVDVSMFTDPISVPIPADVHIGQTWAG